MGIVLAIYSEGQQTESEGVFEMADVCGKKIILHSTMCFHVEESFFRDRKAFLVVYMIPLECTSHSCPPLIFTCKLPELFNSSQGMVRVGSQVFVRKFRIPKFRTGRVADCPGLARVRPNDTTARLKADIPGIQVNKRQLTKPPTELSSIFPSVIADIVMQYCQQFIPFAHDEDIRSCYSSTPAWKVEFQPQW